MGGSEADLVRFAERVIALLDRGTFTATYKYAVMVALLDLCLERSARDGAPPDFVTTRQVAGKIIELYWPHARPYLDGRILIQNRGGQAEILSIITKFRAERAPDPSASLHRARLHDPEAFTRLERDVEWKLVEMPLPKLQRVGRVLDPFLYQIQWGDDVRRSDLKGDFDNRIQLLPGVGRHLVALTGLLRPLLYREWVAMVTRLNGLQESRLEDFLFPEDRAAVAQLAPDLLDLQGGSCFYCQRRVGRGESQVDHFIPWARHPDDGIANLVVADGRCNGGKSDYLAAALHLDRWAERATLQREDLGSIAARRQWPTDDERSASVVRAIYSRLPDDVRLWQAGGQGLVAIDRGQLTAGLARLAAG